MTDRRVEKVADVLAEYSLRVAEGDLVGIWAPPVAEPLIRAFYRRCLERGAHPKLFPLLSRAEPVFFRFASDEQLDFVWGSDEWIVENVDVYLRIDAETNTRQLSNVDPAKQARWAKSRGRLLERRLQRGAEGSMRWSVTLYPTEALAMEANMSLDEYEDFYYGACLVDADDPIGEWRKVAERHRRMIEWMQGRSEVHIEGEATDLVLDVGGRTVIPANGDNNFPDGEIFTAPVEDKTRGVVTFTYPANYRGRPVEGIRLVFEEGRVVEASAERNEKFLLEMLDADPGARVLGEFGIGTNYGIDRFTGEALLDEKIGGTIHLAIGASYPESGGKNQSSVHWDLVCDLRNGGRVTVDGDPLLDNGRLLV